jgi:hypothetical protein
MKYPNPGRCTMPKTYRDNLKRQLAHAHYDLEVAGAHIFNVANAFKEVHPELADPLYATLDGLKIILDVLDTFALEAWGKENPNWQGWRGLSEKQLEDYANEQSMDELPT